MGEGPLTAQDLKFVHWFRKYRDPYKATEKARLPKSRAKRTLDRPEIRDEIERQDLVVEQERAKVQVAAEGITRDLLDAELYAVIKLSPKTHSGAKLKAIEMGYIRAGVLQGTLKSLDLTPPNADDELAVPTVYQAVFTMASPTPATPVVPPAVGASAPPATVRERVRALITPPQPPAAPSAAPQPSKTAAPSYPRAGRMTVG
jgi:hypothetical protein